MLWNCDLSGCFNKKRRPKIEVFHDCFSGQISFGDVDALVENMGALCFLEWKGKDTRGFYPELKKGQRMTFLAISRQDPRNVVFVVNGDAETMEIDGYQRIQGGEIGEFVACDLCDLKLVIAEWFDRVRYRQAAA